MKRKPYRKGKKVLKMKNKFSSTEEKLFLKIKKVK